MENVSLNPYLSDSRLEANYRLSNSDHFPFLSICL